LIYGIFAQASHISLFTFRFAADDSRRTAARSTKKKLKSARWKKVRDMAKSTAKS